MNHAFSLHPLEPRQFLSASLQGNVLVVTGTNHADIIRISRDDQMLVVRLNASTQRFAYDSIDHVIIDAGANIGLASVYFANLYPDAIIVSLEPDRSNFRLLEMNTADYPQIRAVNAALWCEDKQLSLFSPNGAHSGFCTLEKNSGSLQECGEVPAVTLDTLMKTQGLETIDVLKMDIEGAEKEVFQSSSTWIDKVNLLLIELHDHYKPGCSEAFYEATKNFQPEAVMKGETILRLRDAAAN